MSAYLSCQTLSVKINIICHNKGVGLSAFATLKIAFPFKIIIFSVKAPLTITKQET